MKVLNFKFLTTALFLLLTLFAAGCAAQSAPDAAQTPNALEVESQLTALNEIAGTWTLDRAENGDTGDALPLEDIDLQVLELNADGGAVVTNADDEKETLMFRARDGVFTLIDPDGDEDTYSYTIEDGYLILTEADDDDPLLTMWFASEHA